MKRTALPVIAVAIVLLVGAATAQAATYYVTATGNDADPCTQAQPCQTITRALTAHRAAPTTSDVIDVGAGTFVENVTADQASDNGLTIRGTLSGSARQTTIRGSGAGTPFGGSCRESACAVTLGRRTPAAAVKLQNVNVDTDAGSDLTAVSLVGGSDLSDVDASLGAGSNAFATVSQGDAGTVIDHSTIDASNGSFTGALFTDADPTITDSHIVAGPFLGAVQAGTSGTLSVARTWIETSPTGNTAGINSNGVNVTLDSSLITGGFVGVTVAANGGNQTVQVRNTTVDVGQPGVSDSANDFDLGPQSGGNADLTVDSSLLAEGIKLDTFVPPATGSVTCTHSDFQFVNAGAGFDASNCVSGNDGNTTTDPADQFVGGSPFSWELKAGAPAIDTGSPGPLPAGQSTRDLAGNPRVQAPTSATCPGIRDMGAYEHAGVACTPQVTRSPSIKNGSSPIAGVNLGSNVGRWAPAATSYSRQWLRCDSSNVDNCTAIPGKTNNSYTPTNDDAGYVLRLRVVATNAFGQSDPATSAPTGVVAASVPVVQQAPVITGPNPPSVGDQLAGSRGQWLPSPTSYWHQWLRCDAAIPTDCTPISGVNGSRYRVKAEDVGFRIRVEVIASNGVGDSQPAYSTPTSPVG